MYLGVCVCVCVCVCTFAGRVKQRSLERDDLHVVQIFINGHLNRKAGVWVYVGKGQQIRGAHKEVSMERVDGETCREMGNQNKSIWTDSNKL